MNTTTTFTGERLWQELCNKQGWNDASQLIHLEGFLREKGLFDEFALYAKVAADEENGDQRQAILESVGYSFSEDSDQAGAWVWMAPTDACDVSFATREQAVDSAWEDAVTQTKAIRAMTDLDWAGISDEEKLSLVEETLLGD